MFPQTLSEWSIASITQILEKKIFETETFDFKETLPYSKDDAAKIRLRKTCCAFANSDGGFIIFGVLDDKTKVPTERLAGLGTTIDFPEHFGNYPASCSPTVTGLSSIRPFLSTTDESFTSSTFQKAGKLLML